MRKIWMPCFIVGLAFVFTFTIQSNLVAEAKNTSVSTYIKGERHEHWTPEIAANANHKLRIVITNNNDAKVAFHVTDVKTKKKVISETKAGKGSQTYNVSGLYGTYQLYIHCYDKRPYNRNHCDAKAVVYNY